MIEMLCAWTYAAGPLLAKISAAFGMLAIAMFCTPFALDALLAARRWRRGGQER